MGRPSLCTPELMAEICKRLETGMSLRRLCRAEDMPSKTTILDWADADEVFAGQYARARDRGWDARAEVAVAKAQRSKDPSAGRLAFDAERWYLGKMAPKRYGEKLELSGNKDAPLTVQVIKLADA